MCYQKGSLTLILVVESVFLGVALPFLVAVGRLLTHEQLNEEKEDDEQQTVRAFASLLAVFVIQFAVIFCMVHALRNLRWGWLIPYWVWRSIMILGAIAIIVISFVKFNEFYDVVLKKWINVSSAEKAKDIRNSLLVPICAVYIVFGILGLVFSINAAKYMRKRRQEAKWKIAKLTV